MTEDFTRRAGYAPDEASDLALRMEALAAQLAQQAEAVEELARQAFPETATGEYLERHAATRGLTRKAGSRSQGTLTFAREVPASYDILIPAGTLCQTNGETPLRFETVEDATLGAGETEVEVPAQSVDPTPDADVPAGKVTVMVTPPQGMGSVTNQTAFAGGTAPEEDDLLRKRLRESYQAVSNGCNAGYYRQMALEQEGVASAAVLTAQRNPGSLDLVVFGRGVAPSQEQLAALQARVEREREIGVDALVRAAIPTPVDLTVKLAPLPGWDFAAVAADCLPLIQEYGRTLEVGKPLYLSQVVNRVLASGEVLNCQVSLPAGDQHPLQDRVITLGRVEIQQLEVE